MSILVVCLGFSASLNFMRGLVFIFVVACSSAGTHQAQTYTIVPDVVPVDLPSEKNESATNCDIIVRPDSELISRVVDAGARWYTSTGCSVQIKESGIPIHAQGYVFFDAEDSTVHGSDPQLQYRQVCGITQNASIVYISTDEPACDTGETILHELGHLLSPHSDLPRKHAGDGVMADGKSKMRTGVISDNTLEWTCEDMECRWFSSEAG